MMNKLEFEKRVFLKTLEIVDKERITCIPIKNEIHKQNYARQFYSLYNIHLDLYKGLNDAKLKKELTGDDNE